MFWTLAEHGNITIVLRTQFQYVWTTETSGGNPYRNQCFKRKFCCNNIVQRVLTRTVVPKCLYSYKGSINNTPHRLTCHMSSCYLNISCVTVLYSIKQASTQQDHPSETCYCYMIESSQCCVPLCIWMIYPQQCHTRRMGGSATATCHKLAMNSDVGWEYDLFMPCTVKHFI